MLKLPAITYPITVDTIGKAYMLDNGIRASCPHCGKASYLDLIEMIEQRGHDWPIDLIATSCAACGRPARHDLAHQTGQARQDGQILYPPPPRDGGREVWEIAYRRYRRQRGATVADDGWAAQP